MRHFLFLAWLCTLCWLAACDEEPSAEQPSRSTVEDDSPQGSARPSQETSQAKSPQRPAQDPKLVRRQRQLMGTAFLITIADAPRQKAVDAADAAFDEIARLEDLLSEWKADSEVSAINAAAGKHPVEVSEETFRVVEAGLEVSRWSKGAYDLSWAALRGLYSFPPHGKKRPTAGALEEKLSRVRYRDIELDEEARSVFLKRPGMTIGTGSIAKGYALDRAAEILEQRGLSHFMLFGGGQVQVHGKRGNRGWRVGIQHPRANDYIGHVEATRGSISTSGDYEHAFIDDGKRWHHILNLKTGLPVRHTASVTVLSPNGLYADAMSTAIFALGAERAFAALEDAPVDVEAAVLDDEMRLHVTPGMRDQLVLRTKLRDGRLPKPQPADEAAR